MNKITLAFIGFWVVVALVADVIFAYKWGEVGTISWQIVNVAHQWLIIPFSMGYVMGHFTWQLRNAPKYGPPEDKK